MLTPEPMLTSRHGNCAGVGDESNLIEYCGGLGDGRGELVGVGQDGWRCGRELRGRFCGEGRVEAGEEGEGRGGRARG